ncbi:MAG: DnaJ domain-containing protein, partial [Acidobacteriota bacterium]
MAEKNDYYQTLGVARSAQLDEIKRAYRKAALKYHPDRNPGDTEAEARFKEAAEAYSVLADPEKRALYDQYGHEGLSRSGGVGGFDPGIFSDFEDLFGGLFSEVFGFGGPAGRTRGRRSGAARGADLRYDLEIDFEEAIHGTTAQIRVPHAETCPHCHGTRGATEADVIVCRACGGSGQERMTRGYFTIARTCGRCRGLGKSIRNVCPECRGAGTVSREKTLKV